jgi:nucleotide-binding universal stress UspA family protein
MIEFTDQSPREAGAGRVVVGYDGSVDALSALRWAFREAEFRDASVHLVSCWRYPAWIEPYPFQPPMSSEELEIAAHKGIEAAVENAPRAASVEITAQVLEGAPAVRLLEFADTATMIVVGSRGRGGFKGLLLGSVSQHLGEHARCPVVIIHGDNEAHGGQVDELRG